MESQLHIVEDTIDYRFQNFDLLQQAFTRRSYSQENGGQNNEVLEFIGDKALDFAVVRLLTERFGVMTEDKEWNEFKLTNPMHFSTKSKEGIFTDIKKDLVQKKSLANAIEKLGFHNYLFLGRGDRNQNIEQQDSVKEDLFEAIVGAVAIDSDFNMNSITKVVETMLDFDAYFDNEDFDDNYVGKIQEWFQSCDGSLPNYKYKKDYRGYYSCSLTIDLSSNGFYSETVKGKGSSMAKARMDCAYNAFVFLKKQGLVTNKFIEAIGRISGMESARQINELVQKGFISQPIIEYKEEEFYEDKMIWICYITLNDFIKIRVRGAGMTKKEALRKTAYKFLKKLADYDI